MPLDSKSKLCHIFGWASFTAVTIRYVVMGFPIQRDLVFFALVGVAITAVATDVFRTNSYGRGQLASIIAFLFLVTFFVRWSLYDRIAIATFDQQAHLTHVLELVTHGSILQTWGTYSRSPYFIIEQAIFHLVVGLPIIDGNFVMILAASFLPLLLGAALYVFTDNVRLSLVGIVLSVTFPLFTRGAALIETEFLVLLWFGTLLVLLGLAFQTRDTRIHVLLLFVALTALMVHPFYALVFAFVIMGLAIANWFSASIVPWHGPGYPINVILTIGVVVCLATVARAFLTQVSTLALILTQSLDVSFSGIIDRIVDPGGGLGRSVNPSGGSGSTGSGAVGGGGPGGGGDSSGIPNVYKWVPFGLLAPLSALGMIVLLVQRRRSYIFLLHVCAVLSALIVGSLLLTIKWNLGYRTFFFGGFAAIIAAAVAMERGLSALEGVDLWGKSQQLRTGLVIALICVVLVYSTISPLTPFGNNVDPMGERGRAVSEQVQNEKAMLAQHLPKEYNQYDLDVDRRSGLSLYKIHDGPRPTCSDSNKVWDGEAIVACT